MELKTITKEIDGIKFFINQFPARKALRLEKRTVTYLAPMLSILEGLKSLDSEIDFGKIIRGVQETLSNIDESALESFISEMFELVSCEININGKLTNFILNKNDDFDFVFRGKTLTVYKLLIAVMKANNFFFFELMGGGGNLIDIFTKMSQKTQKSEKE